MNNFDSVIGAMPEQILRKLNRPEYLQGLLDQHYLEPWRSFHNYQHIVDCLFVIGDWKIREFVHELAIAILFHDAIYDVKSSLNEEKSAELALKYGPICFGRKTQGDIHWPLVKELILSTKHTGKETKSVNMEMCDIDLHIFDQTFQHFAIMGDRILNEYSEFFPRKEVVKGRKHFLTEWQKRDQILYSAGVTRNANVKENIRREIDRLTAME